MNQNNNDEERLRQCAVHTAELSMLCKDVRDIKIAVCGDERIGIHGLVKDVDDLKEWRRRLDLRVAGIAGAVSAAAAIAKWLMER